MSQVKLLIMLIIMLCVVIVHENIVIVADSEHQLLQTLINKSIYKQDEKKTHEVELVRI